MNTEIKDVEIPANALTTCPDRSYALVGIAGRCLPCPHFRGLYDVMAQDAPFAQKYRVQCGVPQAREITVADLGGA